MWIVRHDQETLIKMTAVDVFVGNYTLIDFELYDLWLNGYTGKLVVFSESRIFAVEACLYIVVTPKVQCKCMFYHDTFLRRYFIKLFIKLLVLFWL